ncbi:MAG: hypothetical protein A2W22_06105 [Candidatus Levybacteria bacterium RBG_16_35_11]|nr:MAG: hypothetical protein A2W22_06105 [Candidatus Levybacteria bacterium RBG_16_35_11]
MTIIKIGDVSYPMDDGVKRELDACKQRSENNFDLLIVVDGAEGCLTGDTIIKCNRATLGRKFTLKWMYYQYHREGLNESGLKRFKGWDLNIPTYVRSFDGFLIKLHKIKDVVYSGRKKVFKLILEDGKELKATANHKILTQNGFIDLTQLDKEKDFVMCDSPRAVSVNKFSYKFNDILIGGLLFHKYSDGGKKRIEIHRIIYEAELNNLTFGKYLEKLQTDEGESNNFTFVDTSKYVIHHKDHNHYNNATDNLVCLPKEEHSKIHGQYAYQHFNQGVPIYQKIKHIFEAGEEDTYDIVCEEPHHNFVANDIVVHNSGKSVYAQQLAYYLDPSFTTDRICFTPREFLNTCVTIPDGSAVIYDEAFLGLDSSLATKDQTRKLIHLLAEVRQKRLYIFLVLPSFFDLVRYVAVHRCNMLVHVYTRGAQRGFFKLYGQDEMKILYLKHRKTYDYNQKLVRKFGTFSNFYPIGKEAYLTKKRDSLNRFFKEVKVGKVPPREVQLGLIIMGFMKTGSSYKDLYNTYNTWGLKPMDFLTFSNQLAFNLGRIRDFLKIQEDKTKEKQDDINQQPPQSEIDS